MRLSDFEKKIRRKVIVKFEEHTGRWHASFRNGDIYEPGAFIFAWEEGNTASEATRKFCRRISGRTLVFNYKDYFDVPAKLTVH